MPALCIVHLRRLSGTEKALWEVDQGPESDKNASKELFFIVFLAVCERFSMGFPGLGELLEEGFVLDGHWSTMESEFCFMCELESVRPDWMPKSTEQA